MEQRAAVPSLHVGHCLLNEKTPAFRAGFFFVWMPGGLPGTRRARPAPQGEAKLLASLGTCSALRAATYVAFKIAPGDFVTWNPILEQNNHHINEKTPALRFARDSQSSSRSAG